MLGMTVAEDIIAEFEQRERDRREGATAWKRSMGHRPVFRRRRWWHRLVSW